MKKGVALYEEWIKELANEIKAIITETIYYSATEIIKGKWLIGEAIETMLVDKSRQAIYGKKINAIIAKIVGVSEREISRCRQFYNKCNCSTFEESILKIPLDKGKWTWGNIVKHYLPSTNEDKTGGDGKEERVYISVKIDDENRIIYLKDKYRNYRIEWILS